MQTSRNSHTERLRTLDTGLESGLQVQVKTAPAAEPILAADFKSYSKIDYTDDDTLITAWIQAAREHVENHTGRRLITQTLTAWWDSYSHIMHMPYAPHQSITTVKLKWQDQSDTLVLDTDYFIQGLDEKVLHINDVRSRYGLEIEYIVGYGAAGSNVPAELVNAVRKVALNLERYRQDGSSTPLNPIPMDTRAILDKYRINYGR